MAGCAGIALAVLGQSPAVQAFAFLEAGVALLGGAVWIDYQWRARH
jgi:hypothetical protein